MGEADALRVDIDALLTAARSYDSVADTVDSAERTHLNALRFDGAVAGDAHVASGVAVRRAVEQLTLLTRQWSRAATEIAVGLRASADRHASADAVAAGRLG